MSSKDGKKSLKLTPDAIDKLEALRVKMSETVRIELTITQALHVLINDQYDVLVTNAKPKA